MFELNSFDELNNEKLIKSIYQYGFEEPANIQKISIPIFMSNKDCIIQSNSGTGKTACFVIGSLYVVDSNNTDLQIVIITNTRELAEQIFDVSVNLSKYLELSIGLYRGGININAYERYNPKNLPKNQDQIAICTPGRLLDMIKKNMINLSNLKYFILDECDELLNDGFVQNIQDISNYLSKNTKVALFSATMTYDVLELSKKLIIDEPFKYLVDNENVTVHKIKQYFINIENDKYKYDNLVEIYKNISISQSIIYCNKKESVEWLSAELNKENFTSQCIYGEMDIKNRMEILKNFKNGLIKILVSTDLLARGIDIQSLQLVINYDIPFKKENYIHRIGRSGRFGKKGLIINLVSSDTIKPLLDICKYFGADIEPLPSLNQSLFN